MPNKPEFNSTDTKLMAGIQEMIEDGLAEMVDHMKDPTTLEGKASTLTLTISVTPDKSRQLFSTEVKRSTRLSGKESFGSVLAAPSQPNGKCEISEFNPQVEMNFQA